MLESITCLIEAVKKKCNPVPRNAQIDRFYDRSDHLAESDAPVVQALMCSLDSYASKKHTVAGRLRRIVPRARTALEHALPAANKLAI
ncbi:hypothetical protein [Burkholderia sp. S171]|uniref:hypothetical protein n=1 Tax=Burkholderia sp. S171 TaxID=1641860 RepID=UPI00131C5B74|nr:hypothetical protein [Burkholderia sp. S171]